MKMLSLTPAPCDLNTFRTMARTMGTGSVVAFGLDPNSECAMACSAPPLIQSAHITAAFGVTVASLDRPRRYHAIRHFVSDVTTGDSYFVAPTGFEEHSLAHSFVLAVRNAFAFTRTSVHNPTPFLLAPATAEGVFVLRHNANSVQTFMFESEGQVGYDDVALLSDGTLLFSKQDRIYARESGVLKLVGTLGSSCCRIHFGHQELHHLYATMYLSTGEVKMVELNLESSFGADRWILPVRECAQPHEGVVWEPIGSIGIRGATPRLFAFVRRTGRNAELVAVQRTHGMTLTDLASEIPFSGRHSRSSTVPPMIAVD